MRSAALLALALCGACVRNAAPAQGVEPAPDRSNGALPELLVHRAAGPLVMDGRAQEESWARAASTGGFVHPGTGRPEPSSGVQASARLLWDDRALYVAVVVHDRDPAAPFARDAVDPHLWERSGAVELMLQPGEFQDNRDYFEVQVDTAGAVWDTRFDDYNRPQGAGPSGERTFGHQDWSARLERGAVVDRAAGRYTLEFALPWDTLTGTRAHAPPQRGERWKANLYSFREGQRDSLAWSPLQGQGNFHRSTRFGLLRFVD